MFRLSPIAAPALAIGQSHVVIGANGDVQFLLVIPVEIPEDHVVASVRVMLPSFKHGSHVLPLRVSDLAVCAKRGQTQERERGGRRPITTHRLQSVCGSAFFALRASTCCLYSSSE